MCAAAVGQNVILNGDFQMQTPSPAPWTTTKSSDQFFQVSGAYGYASEGKMSNGMYVLSGGFLLTSLDGR